MPKRAKVDEFCEHLFLQHRTLVLDWFGQRQDREKRHAGSLSASVNPYRCHSQKGAPRHRPKPWACHELVEAFHRDKVAR